MAKRLSKTKKQEYTTKLTLIGVFLSIFATFISGKKWWRANEKVFYLRPFDLIQLAFSTLRLGRLVAYDLITEPIRYPFTKTIPDDTGAGDTVEPRGQGVRQSLGQLLSCPICSGTWIAVGLVLSLELVPVPTRVFLAIMSTIGSAELLNSMVEAFSWTGEAARKKAGESD